jgi:hypothetical protein
MAAIKLKPTTKAQRDYTSKVLFALTGFGASGEWDDMVDFAMRSMKRKTVHVCVMEWLRRHPQQLHRAYTETQHDKIEGRP